MNGKYEKVRRERIARGMAIIDTHDNSLSRLDLGSSMGMFRDAPKRRRKTRDELSDVGMLEEIIPRSIPTIKENELAQRIGDLLENSPALQSGKSVRLLVYSEGGVDAMDNVLRTYRDKGFKIAYRIRDIIAASSGGIINGSAYDITIKKQ